jgi:hypothetical protein
LCSSFDGENHWIVTLELDAAGKPKRRNCRHCCTQEKKELRTIYKVFDLEPL